MELLIKLTSADNAQNITTAIDEIYSKLEFLKEEIHIHPEKYNMDSLFNILCMIYDDIRFEFDFYS